MSPKPTGSRGKASASRGKASASRGKATVDPRMRARRIGVSRGRARRRLRVLAGVAVTLSLVGVALAVYAGPMFAISSIEVRGVNEASAGEITEALDEYRGMSTFRVNDAELTEVVAGLPGMGDASVDVALSGAVTVTVSDDRPVAYAPTTDATAALVGPTGRVLAVVDEVPQDLVRLEATLEPSVGGAVPQPVMPAVEVSAALPPDLVAVTVAVGAGDDGVELALVHGVRAIVGTTDDLPRKLDSVATLLSKRVESACLERVDVSDPALVTVSRDTACTGAPV